MPWVAPAASVDKTAAEASDYVTCHCTQSKPPVATRTLIQGYRREKSGPQAPLAPLMQAHSKPNGRRLVHPERSDATDRKLAIILASVAGAANAGGFFALGRYTSHMTGYLSQLADTLAIRDYWVSFVCLVAIAAFLAGASFSTMLILWARTHRTHHQYALPIALQGGFLICFSAGWVFESEAGRLFALACLCFIMGMQNATITKLSGARIRTTHATGMVTDIGIEIGRALFGFWRKESAVTANRTKLSILSWQVLGFLAGGIVGAIGFGLYGFLFAIPLAIVLLGISVPSLLFDPASPAP